MVDFSAISGTITALKGVMDVAKAMKDLHASGAIDAQIGELNSKIIEAQVSAFAAHDERATLIERVGTLEAELARLKAWGAEKENYELKEIYRGAFAYALKPNTGRPEPAHWLCPTCFDNRKKSHLQFSVRASIGNVYRCTGCNAAVTTNSEPEWL